MRRARNVLASLLAICACLPANAHATPSVTLHATLTPEQLGHSTTVDLRVHVTARRRSIPPPLTEATVRYPAGLEITLSGLGIATCSATNLETSGPESCPADSLMGEGSAIAEMQIGQDILDETAHVTLVRAPEQEGHLAMLFYVDGEQPISTQTIFAGLLLPARAPFGGHIKINIPLVESLPEAPDVAVTQLHLVLGPQHLTYYEQVNGRTIAYQPKGILLPDRCPPRGFRFAVELGFLEGVRVNSTTSVPCPTTGRETHKARPRLPPKRPTRRLPSRGHVRMKDG